jgi:LPS-assembly protein
MRPTHFFQVDGLRHIVEPSVNYVFVPTPTHRPFEVPQYDFELPSLRLLPLEYPDYNSIDSIDSQNAFRFGLRNRFQTKREGKIENMLFNETFVDWRLDPNSGQARFSDVFSDSAIRPRSWITLESQVRYNIDNQNWRMLVHNCTSNPTTAGPSALATGICATTCNRYRPP